MVITCVPASSGRILNRFSKDTGFLDLLMPDQFVEAMLVRMCMLCIPILVLMVLCYYVLQLQVRVLAVIATAASANGYIVIAAIAVLVVFLSVRWYYLRTSRQIKRLEAIGIIIPTQCIAVSCSMFAVCRSQSSLLPHRDIAAWTGHYQGVSAAS